MRILKRKEKKKRGCDYCTDFRVVRYGACKHDKCPYHELDAHETYNDYLKSCPEIDVIALLRDDKPKKKTRRRKKV